MSKQTYRQQPKHFKGYRRTNFGADLRTNEAKNTIHKITPLAVGRVVNIREKAEVLYGNSFALDEQKRDFIPNPLWQFSLFIMIGYQKIFMSPTKSEGELQEELSKQLMNDLRYRKLQQVAKDGLKEQVKYVFSNLNSAIERHLKKDAKLADYSRVEQLQFFWKWVGEQAQRIKPNAIEFVKEYIKPMPEQSDKELKPRQKRQYQKIVQNYVDELLVTLQAIEPLKTYQQFCKWKVFEKVHSQVFQSSTVNERTRGINNYYMKVAKLSSETEPVLQSLSDFVHLRFNPDNNHQYKVETINFIKDLYLQMQRYQNLTGKAGTRSFYYYLSPENVIIDQYSLSPKLHYEPALLQTFGLSKKPFSLESRLSFQPTPKGPDFFRSLEELDEQTLLKLKDPLYGAIELYENEKQKMTVKEIEKIKEEKLQLQKLKMVITVWRFLLVSFYINFGTEFGRKLNPISYEQVEKCYEKELRKKKVALNKSASELSHFLGSENKRFQGIHFDWRLEQIGEFLQFQNDDSVIKSHKFDRKIRYFYLRWALLKQIDSTLRNVKYLVKLMNVKRYILMYLLNANEIFEESRELLEAEKKKSGQRKSLRRLFQQKPLELRMDYYSDAKTTMDNINKYLDRSPEKDQQSRYLNASNRYIHIILANILTELQQINALNLKLNAIENKDESIALTDRNEYKNHLLKLQDKLEAGYNKIKTITAEYVYVEIQSKTFDELHRQTDQQQQRDQNKLQTKKVVLQFFTYLSANQDNYFLYQSAVAPLIVSEKTVSQNEQPPTLSKQNIEELKNKLEAVEQAINFKEKMPKELRYLRIAIPPNEGPLKQQSIFMEAYNSEREESFSDKKLLQRKEWLQKEGRTKKAEKYQL